MPLYIENSGGRGRHCWIFFCEPVKSKDAIKLCKLLISNIGEIPKELSIEIFPKTESSTEITNEIKILINKCNVIKYLVEKKRIKR